MSGRYWDRDGTDPTPGWVEVRLPDQTLRLRTERGLFAGAGLDRGTGVLLREARWPAPVGAAVDLGCGYGPIAVAMARRRPGAGIWAVDVNRRALAVTRANAAGLPNVTVAEPGQVPAALGFDALYSNPPIKIGKDALHGLLRSWLPRLVPGSAAWLVVKRAMGADSLHRWLQEEGYATARVASKQGYRLLQVRRPGEVREQITDADLAAVRRATGRTWTVLGRLTGGFSDTVWLLGADHRRAVLKIKSGPGRGTELARLVTVQSDLRRVGYPVAEILGTGRVGPQRHFLLTRWIEGRVIEDPSRSQVEAVLDAVARARSVDPPPERDWSAMITLFLNGGIEEFSFHPELQALARRALGLLDRPVPALPTGQFVHGDFTLRNMLFDDDGLAAVVDLEGCGRGTVSTDLLAFSLRLPDRDLRQAVFDRAVELAGRRHACAGLAHRVLAALAWATEHPELIAETREHADRALLLAG